ncbi:DUF4386 family protein [bacterium]|nr:DUF4386 family protein [bacterium]
MRTAYLAGFVFLMFQAFFIFVPMAILGAAIDWPASLDLAPAEALPLIAEQESAVRLGYGLYLLWSLAFALSGALIVGLARGGRPVGALAASAIALAAASALGRAIGIVRWLTGSSELADAWVAAPPGSMERYAIEATQLALNAHGGSVGEDVGVGIFAGMWLLLVGVLILKDRGLPAWLGWIAFPAAVSAMMPPLRLVGVTSPVDTTIATTAMFLWVAAVGVVLLVRAVRPLTQTAGGRQFANDGAAQ